MVYASFIVLVATALLCSSAISAQETGCGENEAKYPCGRLCEERCNATPPGLCNGIRCEGFSCRCINGFARDPYTNRCIPKATCPINKCAYGEIEAACGKRCEGTCSRMWEPEMCQLIRCADRSCRCDSAAGFVRNSNGNCVRIGQC